MKTTAWEKLTAFMGSVGHMHWLILLFIINNNDNDKKYLLYLNRVAKCHGYDGYIRVKNWKVGVKSLGEYTHLQNKVLFWVNLCKSYMKICLQTSII